MNDEQIKGPTRQVVISEKLRKLDARETADLLASYEDGDTLTKPVLQWEIERRLTEVKSTALAFRYLCPQDDWDAEDAFEGLVSLCFKAKGRHLYATDPPYTRSQATREFIAAHILIILKPYSEMDSSAILRAALCDKFRYIPRLIRLRLIDRIRQVKSAKRRGKRVEFPGAEPPERKEAPWQIFEFMKTHESEFRPRLGERNWETLLVFSDAQQADGETRRRWKGRVTEMLQKKRGIGPRQARGDKAALRRGLQELVSATSVSNKTSLEGERPWNSDKS